MNFYTINRGVFSRLHKLFSYQSVKIENRKEIRKMIKGLKCRPLTKTQNKEIKDYYSSFGFNNISTDWHRYITHTTGKYFIEYIPQDIFYNVIEPSLNMRIMFPALTDKNLLKTLFKDVKQPETVIKNVNGLFIDSKNNYIPKLIDVLDKCKKYNKLVIKPSIESGGGKNVIVFNLKGGVTDHKNLSLEKLINLYDKNFVIQNYLIQHEQMSRLNPSSVNTIRFKTLLINNKIEILSAILRIGGKDSKLDNIRAGGVLCKIDDAGILYDNGFTGDGKIILETYSGIKFKGFKIPCFNGIKREVKDLHKQIHHFKMISWDIAIDKVGKLVLIEYNVFGQGFGQEYGPLFGKFTDQILNDCKIKMSS